MAQFKIPSELSNMVSMKRVIPFIGAGFSAPLNMPNWEQLLTKLSMDMGDSLSFKDVKEFCNGDLLQIAEYYYLKCDKSIGPLRHAIQGILQSDLNPVLCSPYHVDLINLGTPQIYTTNFDDFIENTFKALSRSFEVVALPKHVATSDGRNTQIVKYHGDLRYEATLVLTESSYYSRLDFESPMDLKFRSDLLGRSVLFMGYSFRDINIRIIWFKLMKMMKDIPTYDRPISYILRFEPNPVLERLYSDVGIETIVLDPKNEASTDLQKSRLLSEFMFELALMASPDGKIPGTNDPMYLSKSLIDRIILKSENIKSRKLRRPPSEDIRAEMHFASQSRIPCTLAHIVDELLQELSMIPAREIRPCCAELAISLANQIGSSKGVTSSIVIGLASSAAREVILSDGTPWKSIWKSKISNELATQLLSDFEKEISAHEQPDDYFSFDHDIAYLADIAKRIEKKEIIEKDGDALSEKASKLLERASSIYDSIKNIKTSSESEPKVDDITEDIDITESMREADKD